jgi:hypothetical protein
MRAPFDDGDHGACKLVADWNASECDVGHGYSFFIEFLRARAQQDLKTPGLCIRSSDDEPP